MPSDTNLLNKYNNIFAIASYAIARIAPPSDFFALNPPAINSLSLTKRRTFLMRIG